MGNRGIVVMLALLVTGCTAGPGHRQNPQPSPTADYPARVERLWADRDLDPVSGVVNVDGVAVVYARAPGGGLSIRGLRPRDGRLLWSRSAGVSGTSTTDPLQPQAVAGRVVFLAPYSLDDATAQATVVDPHTGRTLRQSRPALFRSYPDACPSGESVCATVARADRAAPVRLGRGGRLVDDRAGGLAPDVHRAAGGLLVDERRPPRLLVRREGDRVLWRRTVMDVFGVDGECGVHLRHDARLHLYVGGARSCTPQHRTIEIADQFAAAAFDDRTGAVRWRRPGVLSSCGVPWAAERGTARAPDIGCAVLAGTLRVRPGQDHARAVRIEVQALEPSTGKTLWRVPLAHRSEDFGTGGSVWGQRDPDHVLVGTRDWLREVDLRSGRVAAAGTATVWAEVDTEFHYGPDDKGWTRAGTGAYALRRTRDGKAGAWSTAAPTYLPSWAAARFAGGLRVTATPRGLEAYRVE